MNYETFLTRIINDGIVAAKRDYAHDPMKQKGAVAGFEACRGKSPAELAQLRHDAADATRKARFGDGSKPVDNYWEVRCFEAEVEWTCNCVSAVMSNEGLPTIVTPTARGFLKAAEVVGVKR